MKNPNGYGSVVKLSGNRRAPFWVRKTIGWNDKGYPIYETVGYCTSREEGNILLAEYNKAPWDINGSKITLEELFALWLKKKFVKLNIALQRNLKSSYNHIKKLNSMKYKDIKSYHMQDCIDTCGCGYSTQGAIKNLWGHLDRFALELDIITKSYSPLLTSLPIPPTTRLPFSNEDIKKVWTVYTDSRNGKILDSNIVEWIDTVLLLLYTGFRISELLSLKTENVNLSNNTFIGGTKTKAGKNRVVPIHSAIQEIANNRFNKDSKYFINNKGKQVPMYSYRLRWVKLMAFLDIDKTPHECRHTFETVLDSNGANRKCIDLLMGHVSKDTGNRVYNHKTIDELKQAIELFKIN